MISVVVPVYKVEKYIEKCVQSVLDQKFTDWELILVDDGSPDRCGFICDQFAERDPRIRVIHQENAGLSAARNAGMEVIRGDFVTFIDSDDFIDSDYLLSLWEALREANADISVAGYRILTEEGSASCADESPIRREICTGKEACIRLMTTEKTYLITAWGKLYSKSLFPLIHYPEKKLNEDEYVTYRLFYESDRVALTGKNSYNYLQRAGSITADFGLRHLEVLTAFHDAVSYFEEKNDKEMTTLARKRLLRVTRILYMKSALLPKDVRDNLLKEWADTYISCRKEIAAVSSLSERLADWLFYRFPGIYSDLKKIHSA